MVLLKSSTVTNFFFVIYSSCQFVRGNTLNSPIMNVDLSNFPCDFVSFYFSYRKVMLLGKYGCTKIPD